MWLLSWLPDSIFHFVVIAGALALFVSYALGFIPFIRTYKFPIQAIAIVVLIFGFFMEGAISNQAYWEQKVAEAKLEASKKETKAAEKTVEVVTKYIDRVKVVKEKQDAIIKEIPKYITKEHDADCSIPDDVRVLINAAARNEIPEASSSANGTASK